MTNKIRKKNWMAKCKRKTVQIEIVWKKESTKKAQIWMKSLFACSSGGRMTLCLSPPSLDSCRLSVSVAFFFLILFVSLRSFVMISVFICFLLLSSVHTSCIFAVRYAQREVKVGGGGSTGRKKSKRRRVKNYHSGVSFSCSSFPFLLIPVTGSSLSHSLSPFLPTVGAVLSWFIKRLFCSIPSLYPRLPSPAVLVLSLVLFSFSFYLSSLLLFPSSLCPVCLSL